MKKVCQVAFSIAIAVVAMAFEGKAFAQLEVKPPSTTQESNPNAGSNDEEKLPAPSKVDVEPIAGDDQIRDRLQRILTATEWYSNPEVRVDEGVVFLTGTAIREEHKTWAGELAQKTQDVVAVVNRLRVEQTPVWDLRPAWRETESIGRNLLRSLPLIGVAFLLIILTWLVSGLVNRSSRAAFNGRLKSPLLADVAARAVTMVVFIVGIYFALRVSGLTQIAATLVGGTGLIGLIIGIAFRDIAENFLASVLISVQRPFALGDLIEVNAQKGFVQSVTLRGTLLMTIEGNHLQIPNAIVYKSMIRNLTSNPNVRIQIDLGIGYDDSITNAQQIILKILQDHEAILSTPEPLVLAEAFEQSSITLRAYGWIDGMKHSAPKVKSSIIRLIKQAIQEAGISIPDAAREIVVPKPIPIRLLREDRTRTPSNPWKSAVANPTVHNSSSDPNSNSHRKTNCEEDQQAATEAEGGLESEAAELEEQAKLSRQPETGTNLLEDKKEESAPTPG